MKKVLFILLASSFLFADIFFDLEKKEIEVFSFMKKEYPIDKTCSRMDLKKFLTIQDELLKNKESKRFYLDVCPPFKLLYNLNKKVVSKKYDIVNTREKYKDLKADYKNSFYIQFYIYLYFHNHKIGESVNYDLFSVKRDDFSKYINIYNNRKSLDRKSKKKEEYFLKLYNEGQELLSSEHDIVYLNVAKDMTKYILRDKEEDYVEFLIYRIFENERRELDTKYLYMDLANFYFDKSYLNSENDFDADKIQGLVVKSYESGKLESQTELFIKLKTRAHYFNIIKTYPKYMNNIEEYDLLMSEFAIAKKFDEVLPKDYYYLASLRAFLYEKILYLKNTDKNRTKLKSNLRKVLLNEKDFRKRRIIKDKIELINENKFFD